ncbi:Tn3 family transposase [Nonomuraea wenchangensis]|uniref:Tn3 family transposase n=1 Tax=Nonomuraea wenchangensis TaxID=568860 RepID=UPI0037997564
MQPPKKSAARERRRPFGRRPKCFWPIWGAATTTGRRASKISSGAQLNVGEGRNGLARAVFFAHHGQLRRGYERGMEDQLGALGLGLNAIIFWNFHGTYPFNRPELPGRLRDLRDPTAADDPEL